MRAVLVLIVLVLDFWALASLMGSDLRSSRKLAWAALIVFIPFIGALLWLRSGRYASRSGRYASREATIER